MNILKQRTIKKKDIGLIIQGLIFDEGYNSNNNINNILFKYSHLFNDILITTWHDQEKYLKIKIPDNKIKIKLLNDPGQPKTYCDEIKNYNDFRIAYQSYHSICDLKNKHVVKVRSDMQINLEAAIEHYFNELERKKKVSIYKKKDESIICGSSFRIDLPYGIGDLLYIGENSLLKKFFYAQIKFKRYRFNLKFGSSEQETVKRYLFTIRKQFKGKKSVDFFPMIKKNILLESTFYDEKSFFFWQFLVTNVFTVLPDDIRTNIKLRDKLVNKEMGRVDSSYNLWLKAEENFLSVFKEEVKKIKSFSFSISLPNYLKICYAKVYEFRKRKKAPIYLRILTEFYFLLNNFLYFTNRIYKKFYKLNNSKN